MKIPKKITRIILLFSVMLILLNIPISVLAGSLNRGDSEFDKSGQELKDEISIDTEELQTHGLKEIGDKKGDFYKAYEDEFDEWEDTVPGATIYVKLIKTYNYKNGDFECGKFDILCHIVNFGFVTGTSIVNALLAPIEKLAITPEKILNDTTLNTFKNAFNTFTTSLLGVFILFQLMKIYAFRMTNHADTISILNEKVLKIIIACVLLFSYDIFFRIILNIQFRVNYGIFNYLTNSQEVTQNVMLSMLLTPNGTVFVLMILFFAILLAVLFFQMLYTFAMISIFYVIGPVAITTMINDDYNMFNMWLKTIISRFLTLALQGLAVILCLSFASRIDFITQGASLGDAFFDKIIALAFLVVGIAIPGLLKEFGNSSGTGRATTGGVKAAATMFIRK